MEDISDEEIHSLATEWMNKIKSNVGLSCFPKKQASDFAADSSTGEKSYSVKQVQNSYDVIYRKGKDNNELEECKHNSLVDLKRNVSTVGNHNEQQRNPVHTSLLKDKATEVFEKQYSKDNSDGLANVDYHVLKSRLEKRDTVQRYDQCYRTKEEPRKEILDSNNYLSSFAYSNNHSRESPVMPTQHLDYSKPSSVVLSNKPDFGDNASSEDHNELFELWDFDADQCETALKYLNKTAVKDKPSSRDLHEKENIPDQSGLLEHNALSSKVFNSEDDGSTFGDKSRGNWFNDITNIRQDITNIGQDITNENHISEVSSKKIDFESEILSPKSRYYKTCPVCKQQNEATANWCEECGKALVSVEVKRLSSDIKTERNNNDNIHLISKSNPELTNLDEDKKISNFKLNPNSAEFVSAYSKPQSQKGTNIDSHSFNGSLPVDYSPGEKQYNVQMQSPRDQPVRYAGSFPGNQFGNFNSWQVSPKHAWSPTHFSPDMASVGYMKGNVDSMFPRNSYEGAYASHSGYTRSNKNGIEYIKHLPNTSKLQNFSQVNPSTASFSYDSSYSNYLKDVKSRPRSTSLLNIQLNTASPGLADPRFPISFGDASSSNHHQNVQHCVQVAQPQLEAISNGYQGFDFENPQFDPQFSECQAFNETVFSQQFVQSRLHQQIESAYGDPQKYQYYQPSAIPNPLYLQSTNLIQNDVNSGQADPLNRMYRKKKLYNSSLDSPRSPKNILRKTKKEKTKFIGGPAKVSRHKDFKDMSHKKLSESNIIVSFSEDEQASSGDQVIVPPLSLEDLDTYDQALTLIRTAREEAVPYLCLPEEIILYILSFLPTSDLCRCARVCKQFHRISTDESLWKEIALRKRNDLSDEILAKIGQKRPISLTISQCHSNMVTEGGLRDLFRNCGESLQDLGFSACSGKALIGELILLHASRCKGLRSIDISWSNVSDIGIQAFSEAVDRLECICMNGCQAVTDESIRCIAVRHSKSIRVIEMFGCFNISYVSLSILQQYCPNLETVNMGQCHKVTNVSVSEFSKQMPKLENIDLRGCKKIRDGAIKDLASNCRSLSTLVIANCSLVTDASLLAIASNLSSIRCLDVCGCTEISDHGVEALAKACNKLEVLDLSSTKATDKGVISLANYCHQTLESLKLSFCHSVTESSLEQLAKKCSRLKLLHLYGCKRVRNVNEVQELNRKLVIESEAR